MPGTTSRPRLKWFLAELSIIEVALKQVGCRERQVQCEPGSGIAHIASNQLADSSEPVRERVAVDAESMRGIGVGSSSFEICPQRLAKRAAVIAAGERSE